MPDTAGPAAFFRHLPKTAGTSLITTLSNIYGDAHCHRFETVDENFAGTFRSVLEEGTGSLALLSGHVPISIVQPGSVGREFTILRDPIARVLSLGRFLQRRPPEELAAMGLGERISVADLLASSNPSVYSQVRNGLTRFFCGPGGFADPMRMDFWRSTPPDETIAEAAETAGRMIVGTVEDMSATLSSLARLLQIPYSLEVPVENTTATDPSDPIGPDDYRRLVEANVADIALYQSLRARMPNTVGGLPAGAAYDPRTVFDPRPGTRYPSASVAGRQGFAASEPSGICWLGPTGRGRIHIAPSSTPTTLRLEFYTVVPHYPLDAVSVSLDGSRWHGVTDSRGHSPTLRLSPIPPHDGILELAIHQPWAVPVAAIDPHSPDSRSLGLGLIAVARADD